MLNIAERNVMKTVDFDEKIKEINKTLAEIVPQSQQPKPDYEVDPLKFRQQLQLVANELLAIKDGRGKTTQAGIYDILQGSVMNSLRAFRADPSKEKRDNFLAAVKQDLGFKTADQFREWIGEAFKEVKNGN